MHIITCNDQVLHPDYDQSVPISFWKLYKVPPIPYMYGISERFGKVFYYELPAGDFKIYYHFFDIEKKVKLSMAEDMDCPEIFIPLWGSYSYQLKGIGDFFYAPNEFGIRYVPHLETVSSFRKWRQPGLLRIPIPMPYFAWLASAFEGLAPFYDRVLNGLPAIYCFERHPQVSVNMINEVEDIVGCRYKPILREIYSEAVIKSFLIQAVKKLLDARGISLLPVSPNLRINTDMEPFHR